MSKQKNIPLTEITKKNLTAVKKFLKEEYGMNASWNDCVAHLIRFWQENKRKQNGAVQENHVSA